MNAPNPQKPGPQAASKDAKPEGKTEGKGAVPMVVKGGQAPEVVKPAQMPAKHEPKDAPVRPPARNSRFHLRHALVLLSFLVMVAAPAGVSGFYLWNRAADQYASFVGFSVRSEENGGVLNSMLMPLNLGGGSTPDAEILYEFIQSQDLVTRIDEALDLREIWSRPENDPVFAYDAPGTIEDLRDHWQRMVHISFDGGTGLTELRVNAFTPEDARAIAGEITAESTRLINELSLQAREDAIRYAREELDDAVARLKEARGALTEFRNRTQIVDPTIDVQGQAGILNQLNTQLAQALIDLDMLQETTREGDPRIEQAERRIRVIEARIEDEKRKLGIAGGGDTEAYADLVGEYESLVVDREFAERRYTAALASFDTAQAEARRQSRYLAVHLQPTLAEQAEYPQRMTLLALITLFAFLIWAILVLVAYSLRDRR